MIWTLLASDKLVDYSDNCFNYWGDTETHPGFSKILSFEHDFLALGIRDNS